MDAVTNRSCGGFQGGRLVWTTRGEYRREEHEGVEQEPHRDGCGDAVEEDMVKLPHEETQRDEKRGESPLEQRWKDTSDGENRPPFETTVSAVTDTGEGLRRGAIIGEVFTEPLLD